MDFEGRDGKANQEGSCQLVRKGLQNNEQRTPSDQPLRGMGPGFARQALPVSAAAKRQLGRLHLVRVAMAVGVLAISACAWVFQAQSSNDPVAFATPTPTPTPTLSQSNPAEVGREVPRAIRPKVLPAEAQTVMSLVLQGGPFPYEKDGTVFGNRERLLPIHPRGYYREYTVARANAPSRGAKRIVCGGQEPTQPDRCYYTADHYASFAPIDSAWIESLKAPKREPLFQ